MMVRFFRSVALMILAMLAVACVRDGGTSGEPLRKTTTKAASISTPSPVLTFTQQHTKLATSVSTLVPTASTVAHPSGDPESYVIELKVGKFDPLVNTLSIPDELVLDHYPSKEGYYIIQFDGPILDEWLGRLDAIGARRIGYVPNYSYLVEMTPDQKERVALLAHLRWIGLYQPGYKISPDLSDKLEGRSNLTVLTFPQTDIDAICAEIIGWGGGINDVSENQYSGTILGDLDMKHLVDLARLPGVMWIEIWSSPGLH